ncbi:hypothetical protein [Gracilibacillus dipsosauri]|uniref:Uncharacterized protein n=1 Tax=Gracilibacillus dipsosauri TaxID=178340 RepID=A0A317KUU1_9BACI|nr:hypothetical protein [Gracilibacillus dipsosauri]PWU67312.1 hypothetical protein DLJ74_17260 [Gracilibacillus dipsosauri]
MTLEKFIPTIKHAKNSLFCYKNQADNSNTRLFTPYMKYVIFLSVTDTDSRARVFTGISTSIEYAYKNAERKCLLYINKNDLHPKWAKVDLAINMELLSKREFMRLYSSQTPLRKGVALDSHFNLAFLEQEFEANDLIQNGSFSMRNINIYLKMYRNARFPIIESYIREIVLFDTVSYFCDEQNYYPLHSNSFDHGRRVINDVNKALIYDIIDQSSSYLAKQIKPNGKFVYGYYSHFHEKIEVYSIHHHARTIYSMIDAFCLTKRKELELPIKRGLAFYFQKSISLINHPAHKVVVQYIAGKKNKPSVNLGAMGATIIVIIKYTKAFQDDRYLPIAKSIGDTLLSLQNQSSYSDGIHSYYNWEALLSLLYLYELDNDIKWLNSVTIALDYSIENGDWKNIDNWLIHTVNQLTKYKPEDKYFKFGLRNAEFQLDFIQKLHVSSPAVLEALLVTTNIIENIQYLQKSYLLVNYPLYELNKTIQYHIKHQLNEYFFPEVSMYMKFPKLVNGTFFNRENSFRSRIDEIRDYVSSYYHYYQKISQPKKVYS